MEDLKLYVWRSVLCDYTCGIAFALARSVEEAREMIKEELGSAWDFYESEFMEDPLVVESQSAFLCYGGG